VNRRERVRGFGRTGFHIFTFVWINLLGVCVDEYCHCHNLRIMEWILYRERLEIVSLFCMGIAKQ
jgi:hypothetical protein